MPKPASGLRMSTSSGRIPSGPATFAANQPAIASRAGEPESSLTWDRSMRPVDARFSERRRLHRAASTRRRRRANRPGSLAAGMALNFPARRLGQAQHLDQPDRVDVDVVLLGDCAADRRDDLLVHPATAIPLDLLDDRQPLLAVDLDREGRGAAGASAG